MPEKGWKIILFESCNSKIIHSNVYVFIRDFGSKSTLIMPLYERKRSIRRASKEAYFLCVVLPSKSLLYLIARRFKELIGLSKASDRRRTQ